MNTTTEESPKLLVDFFTHSVKKHPTHPALEIAGKKYSYSELHSLSASIAHMLNSRNENTPFVTLLSYRSQSAYAGVLGILLSGKGYVPLNPKFPIERTLDMINISGSKSMIVGQECIDHFTNIIPKLQEGFLIIFPDTDDIIHFQTQYPQHTFIGKSDISGKGNSENKSIHSGDDIAYLLFTSGSTGVPKGVPVSNTNAVSYINYVLEHYPLSPQDRCSQAFDLTFDPSIHDMFTTWGAGACLCVVSTEDLLAPATFIKDKKLTVWYSVPSIGKFLSQMRMLKPDSFPLLRYSIFSAEALTQKMTEEWAAAAPKSTIINYYGPTEASINITHYAWDKEQSPSRCINGNVPIGWVFETQQYAILDEHKNSVKKGDTGELYLSGSQVTKGYFNSKEKTIYHYTSLKGRMGTWYRTSDIVKEDLDGCIHFLGRADDQIKIRGFRIELQEVEHAIRTAAKTDMVVAMPLRNSDGSPKYLVAFVGIPENEESRGYIREYCMKKLPDYMIPQELYFVEEMPLNANGKIDKKKLLENIS